MKIFVAVMNIPSPYRLHLLGEMARQLEKRGIAFHCHFMAKGHADRPKSWLNPKIDFPHTYWRDYGIGQHHFNPGLIMRMLSHRCDWMICGSSFDTFTGIAIQLFGRAKTKLCWLEGNTKTPGKMNGPIGWFKRLVISCCRFAAVPGSDAAKYIGLHQALTRRKMPKPVFLPNLVDETRFVPRDAFAPSDLQLTREKMGASEGDRICLIPARLEPVKGLVPFFELLSVDILSGWRIVLVGQGSLRESIQQVVRSRGLETSVLFLDYVSYDDMPKYYAASDLLLLPSLYDPNPLSVIEAVHARLPIALSDQAGNVEEAVTEGRNGWVLPVLEKKMYAEKLKDVFSTPMKRLRQMGIRSREENATFWETKRAIGNFVSVVTGVGE